VNGNQSVLTETPTIDKEYCASIVMQYMQGQEWRLIDPQDLTDQIWGDLTDQDLSQVTVKQIQDQVWQRYAEVLHEACCQPPGDMHEQAWFELLQWLEKKVGFLPATPKDTDRLIQEVLISLHEKLEKAPLKAPRAFWVFALQALKRKNIDLNRRDTAVKRGGGDELYLEELAAGDPDVDQHAWEEKRTTPGSEPRVTEKTVINREISHQVRAFFQAHLPTDLQRQVAEAHFLDGLSPRDIAQLMGKQPHEIRLVKARAVQKLRNLPSDEYQTLLEILEKRNGDTVDE